MDDPALQLHKALVARLKGVAAVTNLVGQRVYDRVPTGAVKPYINLGPPRVAPDRTGCEPGAEVNYPIHGWSAGPDSVEIKSIGSAILAALDEYEFAMDNHRTVLTEVDQVVYLDDPDGTTKHVALNVRILTEPSGS